MTHARLIRLPELCRITGLSRSSVYSLIQDGTFPKQIKLTLRCSAWVMSEVENWIEQKITSARDSAEVGNG